MKVDNDKFLGATGRAASGVAGSAEVLRQKGMGGMIFPIGQRALFQLKIFEMAQSQDRHP
jgi:hypothetical protein